jgi:hypothetical protein
MVRLWDFMVWVCVAFPLLTGGVWIHRPGLKLELAEMSAPVAVVALVGWLLMKFGRAPLAQASSVRLATRAWNAWSEALRVRPARTLMLGWLAFGSLWAFAAMRRHWHFGTHAGDLGIFTSAMWNLTHGYGYVSSVKTGMNLFRDHQSPILWLLAPAFDAIPWPETLLIAQSFTLAAGAPALYGLGQQARRASDARLAPAHDAAPGSIALPADSSRLRAWLWPALPLLYWAYQPTRNANLFDFHPETAMLPLALGFVFFLQRAFEAGRASSARWSRAAAWIFLLLTLGAKESGGIVVAALGLAIALGFGEFGASRSRRRLLARAIGVALIPIGVGVFLFDIKVVPGLAGGDYAYLAHYSSLGPGLGGLVLAPFLHPVEFWSLIFQASRLKFLIGTLAPLAFLPLTQWRPLLIAGAAYLPLFLDPGAHRVGLGYHYSIEPSIGLFLALPGALLWARDRSPLSVRPWLRANLGACLVFFALLMFGRSEAFAIRLNTPDAHDRWLRNEALPALQAQSLAASGALVPQLIQRPWVHHLPNLDIPQGAYPGRSSSSEASRVECVVFDPAVNNFPLDSREHQAFEAGTFAADYQLEYECHGFRVYRRDGARACLARIPLCPTGDTP